MRGLVPTSPGVTVTVAVQLELGGFDPLFAESVQGLPLNVSLISGELNETVPPGADAPAPALSVTVTVTVLGWPTAADAGFRLTVVEVLRAVTLIAELTAEVKPVLVAVSV